MTLIIRPTKVYSIDEYKKIDVMDFSQLRLIHPVKLESGRPIDIGSVAYSIRQAKKSITSRDGQNPTLVDLKSFRKERLFCISNFSSELIKNKAETHKRFFDQIIQTFDWFDANGFEDFLVCTENSHQAYLAYTNYLIERKLTKNTSYFLMPRTAKDMQGACIRLIEVAFPEQINSVIGGIKRLKAKNGRQKEPITNKYIETYWLVNYEIFNKFSDSCFDNTKFPPFINVIDIKSYYYPIAGKATRLLSEHSIKLIEDCNSNKKYSTYFNLITGEIYPETIGKKGLPIDVKKHTKFVENHKKIKKNSRHIRRIEMAFKAKEAFVQLFRIMTRINNSDLLRLKYEEKFDKKRDKTSQQFYSIKFRAGNKKITLRLEVKGYELFKKYLNLREWLLDGIECEQLFFSPSQLKTTKTKSLSRQHTDQYHNYLKAQGFLSSDTKALQDQQIRNNNTIFLKGLGYSAKEVADNNNHTEETSGARYSQISKEQQAQEIGNYFDAIKAVGKVIKTKRDNKTTSTTSASCDNKKQEPKPIIANPIIKPDCQTPQGCLFCVYFVCHADEEDLRKLLSLLFVVLQILEKTIDIEFAEQVYTPIVIRIESILDEITAISSTHANLIKTLKKEVLEDGVVTAFWNNRLDHYEELGLINK
jgi:hypothetical protein